MKRLIRGLVYLLAFSFLFSLLACGTKEPDKTTNENSSTSIQNTIEKIENNNKSVSKSETRDDLDEAFLGDIDPATIPQEMVRYDFREPFDTSTLEAPFFRVDYLKDYGCYQIQKETFHEVVLPDERFVPNTYPQVTGEEVPFLSLTSLKNVFGTMRNKFGYLILPYSHNDLITSNIQFPVEKPFKRPQSSASGEVDSDIKLLGENKIFLRRVVSDNLDEVKLRYIRDVYNYRYFYAEAIRDIAEIYGHKAAEQAIDDLAERIRNDLDSIELYRELQGQIELNLYDEYVPQFFSQFESKSGHGKAPEIRWKYVPSSQYTSSFVIALELKDGTQQYLVSRSELDKDARGLSYLNSEIYTGEASQDLYVEDVEDVQAGKLLSYDYDPFRSWSAQLRLPVPVTTEDEFSESFAPYNIDCEVWTKQFLPQNSCCCDCRQIKTEDLKPGYLFFKKDNGQIVTKIKIGDREVLVTRNETTYGEWGPQQTNVFDPFRALTQGSSEETLSSVLNQSITEYHLLQSSSHPSGYLPILHYAIIADYDDTKSLRDIDGVCLRLFNYFNSVTNGQTYDPQEVKSLRAFMVERNHSATPKVFAFPKNFFSSIDYFCNFEVAARREMYESEIQDFVANKVVFEKPFAVLEESLQELKGQKLGTQVISDELIEEMKKQLP